MSYIFSIIVAILAIVSCGQPIVHKHLTDRIYLIAPDEMEQLSVSYQYSGASYTGLVNETVISVGYNDDFVIVKQSPNDKDTTLYYIIDVNAIKKDREKFVSKVDTIRYSSHYKDINGKDSLSAEQVQISDSKFSPVAAKPMTLEAFKIKRKQLRVPEDLDFTISYD